MDRQLFKKNMMVCDLSAVTDFSNNTAKPEKQKKYHELTDDQPTAMLSTQSFCPKPVSR